MRILMLIDQFHPIRAGAEQQALRLCRKIMQAGHRVTVLTRKSHEQLSDVEAVDGLTIHRLPASGYSYAGMLWRIMPATRWLIKNRREYDIIHCHGQNPLEWSALLSRCVTGKPYIVKITNPSFLTFTSSGYASARLGNDGLRNSEVMVKKFSTPALRFLRTRFLCGASCIISVTPEIRSLLNRSGFHNVIDIPNGIDTDEFTPATPEEKTALRRKLGIQSEALVYISVGRLSPVKNLKNVILAWEAFSKNTTSKPARLIMLGKGDGPDSTYVEEIQKLTRDRMVNSICWKGSVPNVREYLRAGDIFILCSFYEGMSNAVLEAMSCGLPLIVSDIPGNRNLVGNGEAGLLCDPYNSRDIKNRIQYLAEHPEVGRKIGEQARRLVVGRNSITRVTQRTIDAYREVLGQLNAKAGRKSSHV